jgi:predicted dehydrogenase
MRIGIIGLDSTHAIDFTQRLNAPTASVGWRGARVVAACAGTPTDFPLSVTRRDRIAARMRDELGIPQLSSATALVEFVDAVMILGCDGRSHLAETLPLLPAGKPLFIDKPLTASLTDAAHLLALAQQTRCPVFSASALRYRSVSAEAAPLAHSRPNFIEVTVPKAAVPGHPDFSWHGIHGVETVFAALGGGCETVERARLDDYDAIRATWSDGARAIIKRSAESSAQGFPSTLTDEVGNREAHVAFRYEPLLTAVVDFFQQGESPVSAAEMLEVIAFIAAADLSRDLSGQPVHLPTILKETGADL